jgi:3'-phosphoadenosine 5'-phosphosulfate (PAPS) 3'-phosphatase
MLSALKFVVITAGEADLYPRFGTPLRPIN